MGGDDDLTGGDLEDVIYGGDGRDNFYPSGGNDSFFGGEGSDRVKFEEHVAGVIINQQIGFIDDGLGNTLTIDGIEYFNGTKFDDVFYSKDTFAHWKAFNGVGGNDEIFLADGLDWIAVDHWNNDDGEINKLTIHNYNSLEKQYATYQPALDTYGVYTFTDVINVYDNNYGYDTNQWYEEFAAMVDNSDPDNVLTYVGVQTSSRTIDDLVTLHGDFALRALQRFSDDDVSIYLDNNALNSYAEAFQRKNHDSDLYIPNFDAKNNLIFLWDHQFDEENWEEQIAFRYNSDFSQTYIDVATQLGSSTITLEGYFGLGEDTVLLDDGARTNSVSSADLKLFLNDLNNTSVGITSNSFDTDLVSSETFTYVVTALGGKYYIDGVLQDSLHLDAGNSYIFDYSSASSHPLKLSMTPDGTHAGGNIYADGVTDLGNNRLQIDVSEDTPDLYYYCRDHSGMGGSAQVVSDIVGLSETSDIGSLVGITAYAEDLDAFDSVSYSLSDDAGGLFAIDGTSGVVTLAGQLDYETSTNHVITVLASSTDGSTSTADFMIDVVDEEEVR